MPLRGFILFLAVGMLCLPAHAQDASKQQTRNLDELVQQLKTETLDIGAQMRLLEERLLYPSGTQVAVFVSLENASGFRLDSIEVQLDGKPAAQHLYTLREIEALQKGGVQRIYAGNVGSGEHSLQVSVTGKPQGGSGFRKTESFKFTKEAGTKVLEVHLVDAGSRLITLRDW